ncbi:MAG: lysophospholipase [Bdellovibrionaceae bacterium]|nr:lysophospholipase [Pseudobdellovibrionaceae bacterium]
MIQRAEFLLKTNNSDQHIYMQRWKRDDWPSDATILITHGIAEHSDSHHAMAEALADQRFQVYAWDLPGHGKSYGQRGYVHSFDEFTDSLDRVIIEVEKHVVENTPLYLFGHSLGGLITITYALKNPETPVKSLLLSSPGLGVKMHVPIYKDRAARLLNIIAPKVTIPHEIRYEDLSRDRNIVASYYKDPLRHKKFSAPLYLGILKAMDEAQSRAHHLHIPMLIQAAGADQVVDVVATQEFYAKVSSEHKKLIVYPDSYHEIFNDINRQEVIDDLLSYLRQ